MAELKSFYDRLIAAQVKRDKIVNDLQAAIETPEGDAQVDTLTADLDAAQVDMDKAQSLYDKAKKALSGGNVAKNFLPVSGTETESAAEDQQPKSLTLKAYNALTPKERLAFAKSGGTLED